MAACGYRDRRSIKSGPHAGADRPLSPGPALGAYPIMDYGSERPLGVVFVSKQSTLSRDLPHVLGRFVAAFSLATVGVLAISSVFALAFSAVAAYLLSRRLGGRLERLS